jgi:hypothetical protein
MYWIKLLKIRLKVGAFINRLMNFWSRKKAGIILTYGGNYPLVRDGTV